MPLYDLTEFLKLSSVLNYNLSAASLNRYNPYDFEAHQWMDMESRLYSLLERMGDEDESKLLENIISLTRIETESYYQYSWNQR